MSSPNSVDDLVSTRDRAILNMLASRRTPEQNAEICRWLYMTTEEAWKLFFETPSVKTTIESHNDSDSNQTEPLSQLRKRK